MPITSATRSRLGEHLTGRLRCWRSVAVSLVQTALAAAPSWFAAVHLLGHRAVQAAVSAILVATMYVPGDTSGIDRDGLIGAALALVIVAVFARRSVCGPTVAVTGPGVRGAAS